MQYCTCNCCSKKSTKESQSDPQFIKEGGPYPSSREGSYGSKKFSMDRKSGKEHKNSYTWMLQTLIVALTLATVGVSAWGMAASLEATDHQITNFWGLVDMVDQKVANTTQNLQVLDQQLATLQTSAGTLSANAQAVNSALAALGQANTGVATALAALEGAGPAITTARQGIQSGINTVDQYMGSTISSMQNNFMTPSLAFEDKGRYIAFVVMFSVTIIAALGAGFLTIRVGHPVWASVFTALLWFCVALLMLLGVAFLQGLRTVSKDACLYAETFAVQYVQDKISDPQKKQWILNAFTYYFNQAPVTEDPPGTALAAVTGVDVTGVYGIIMVSISLLYIYI